jgi:signal transduction histidine kinase
VRGDRKRLLEVFLNLLDNSVKFMGDQPEPRIEIGMRKGDDGNLVFYVGDNGIGIEPRFNERIFGIFHKLDAMSEGTGIGLALVKSIIEMHAGKVWVESEGLDKGTMFCFTIPNRMQAE